MSGTAQLLFPNEDLSGPLDPNSPEGKAFLAQNRAAAVGATSILPGLASLVMPGQTPVPGIVPQTYNFANSLTSLAHAVGLPVPASLPGSETSEKMAKDSLANANSVIPHMTPTNPIEQSAADMGNAAGEMGPLGVGGGLIKGLPKAAQTVLKTVIPAIDSTSAAPVAAAITGGVGGVLGINDKPQDVTDILNQQPVPDADASSSDIPIPPIPPTTPPQAKDQPLDVTHILNAPHDITDGVMGETTKPGLLGNQPTPYTLGEVAMFGAGAIALIAGRKQAAGFLDTLAGGMREKMYQGAADLFNSTETALQNGAPNLPHVEAPLPVGAGGLLNRLNTGVANSNARIQAYTDVIAANKTDADVMRAYTGTVNNSAAFHGRVADIGTTGVDPVTGVTMPSLVDHFNRVGQFTPQQMNAFNEARFYANELDNRTKLYNQAMSSGAPLNDEGFRVNFPNTDSNTLRTQVTQALADPAVKAEVDTSNQIHRQLMTAANQYGLISPQDMRDLITSHPNYLASINTDGTLQNTFGVRDMSIGGGYDNISINASEVDKQHFTELYRTMELNAWKREIVDRSLAYQQANPDAAQIFRVNKVPQPPPGSLNALPVDVWVKPTSGGDTIQLMRDGVRESYKVGNTPLLQDMTAGNQQMGTTMAALNYSRNLLQSGVTGIISAAMMHFFPIINAVRSTVHGSMFQAPGMAYGPLTSLVQKATGVIGHLPVASQVDAALGTASGLMQGIGAEGARFIANAFDPAKPNFAQSLLRSSLGDNWVTAAGQRMSAAWDTSIRAEMKSQGVLHAAGTGSAELPAIQPGARQMNSSPFNNLAPELFRAQGILGGVTPKLVRMRNLYNELADVVNEAAQTHFYSTNKGKVPQEVLNHETRNFIGDPGQHGSNAWVKVGTQSIPYGNMIIQDVARIGRAFAEQPLASAYKSLSTLGTLALASNYSALLAGPQHVDHLTNQLTDDQHASRVIFYSPNLPPESAPYIELPQNIRVMYPIILQAMHDALNTQGSQNDPDFLSHTMDWLHSYFSRHVTEDTAHATLAGASSTISPSLPPIAGAAFNSVGLNVQPSIYNQAMPGETAVMPMSGDSGAPGHAKGTDPLTGTVVGNHITHTVASMLGTAGSSILQAYGSLQAGVKRGKDAGEILSTIGSQELDRLKDTVPFLRGIVFNNQSTVSMRTPLEARVDEAQRLLQPLRTYKSDAKYGPQGDFPGMTRAKGPVMDQMPEGDNNIPKDPTMAAAYYSYGAYASYIDKKLYPQITDIRKQINNLASDPGTPDEIKTKKNTYQKQLRPLYEQLAGVINDADAQASQILGRKVNIKGIDWHKGMDQFQ